MRVQAISLGMVCCMVAGCQTGREVHPPPLVENQTKNPDKPFVIGEPSALPEVVRLRLTPELATNIEEYLERIAADPSLVGAHATLQLDDGFWARVPGYPLPVRMASEYDGAVLEYKVRSPWDSRPGSALIVVLGDASVEGIDGRHWVVSAPTRARMNYQLLSEGDLWSVVTDVQSMYPDTASLPLILVGVGPAADAALMIANNQRWRCQGLAFSGGRLGLDLPNLDGLPVAYFTSEHEAEPGTPWGRKQLVAKLRDRGNIAAFDSEKDLAQAVEALLAVKDPLPAANTYQFTDYRDARGWPWLRVVGKRNEEEPVVMQIAIEGNALKVEGFNIFSVELDRDASKGFPESVTQVRLNGQLYTFPKGTGPIAVGDGGGEQWKRKVDTPPGLLNFFRSEPVYIVYQDEAADPQYLERTQQMAMALSRLQLSGLIPFPAALPALPLSSYDGGALPPHRAIFIGTRNAVQSAVTTRSDYWPVEVDEHGLRVGNRRLADRLQNQATVAYGLIYPPEIVDNLRLALLLVAEDTQGLQVLGDNYLTATALYRNADLRLWSRESAGGYSALGDYAFDSYWGTSALPTTLIEVPYQQRDTWSAYLHNLLVEESRLTNVVAADLVDPLLSPPTNLGASSLYRFVPNKHFVVVTLPRNNAEWAPEAIANAVGVDAQQQLMAAQNAGHRVLVEAKAWAKVPEKQREQLPHSLFPYSLHELVMQRLEKNPAQFGRELIRTGNDLGGHHG